MAGYHKIVMKSRMMGDYQVRFCERLGVKLPRSTRQRSSLSCFPVDFMLEINASEFENLRSQSGTLSWGGVRYQPMAFTEQVVAMLSSVLHSAKAIRINIAIMRAFVQLRRFLESNKELVWKQEVSPGSRTASQSCCCRKGNPAHTGTTSPEIPS
jgi:hypothetical protein